MTEKTKTIKLKPTSYQPSKAEMREEFRISTTPKNLAKALVKDVKIKHEDGG